MEDRRDGGDRSAGAMAYADESGEEANISRVPGGLRESRFRKNCAEFTQPLVKYCFPRLFKGKATPAESPGRGDRDRRPHHDG